MSTQKRSLHYLFLDLETTGLDERLDDIIELGVVGTTAELQPIFERSYVVAPTVTGLARLMAIAVLVEMHTNNGLLADLHDPAKTSLMADVERDLIELITEHRPENGKVLMGGSGVSHFDDRFLPVYLPNLNRLLHYNTLDIGVMRIAYETWTGTDLTVVNELKTHRALDDVYCHIAESKAFRTLFIEAAQKRALVPSNLEKNLT